MKRALAAKWLGLDALNSSEVLPHCFPTLQEIDAELDAAAEQLLALLQALQDREKLANPLRQRLVSGLRCDLPELTSRPGVHGMTFRFDL